MLSNFFSSIAHASSSSSSRGTSGASADNVDTDATHAELNEYLEILAQVFPEADIEDIRERLLKSSVESRLHLVTESLLIIPSKGARPNSKARLEPAEKFRSWQYQTAVKNLLYVSKPYPQLLLWVSAYVKWKIGKMNLKVFQNRRS